MGAGLKRAKKSAQATRKKKASNRTIEVNKKREQNLITDAMSKVLDKSLLAENDLKKGQKAGYVVVRVIKKGEKGESVEMGSAIRNVTAKHVMEAIIALIKSMDSNDVPKELVMAYLIKEVMILGD